MAGSFMTAVALLPGGSLVTANVSATWTSPTGSQCVATLMGCIGVDFTSILAKQRQAVTSIFAEAHGEQDQDPPWAFKEIGVVFTLAGPDLDQRAVDRALNLAVERYCSVDATLAGKATITHRAVVIRPQADVAVA
jgi:uncharacterized OsmC-like protein